MLVVKSKQEVRSILKEKRSEGKRIGLVPTMGALHEGHLSLVRAVKPHCDFTVMWIFLNPIQFNSLADYERYPRVLDRDCKLAQEAGVDLVFAPSVDEIYPRGVDAYYSNQTCRVKAGDRSEGLCGAFRPGHFDGVVQVVSIFFNILEPDIAVFGEKDYQQVQVIKQMVEDLHFNIEILVAPIIREQSGLALSSRNELLTDKSKGPLAISGALLRAKELVAQGEADAELLCKLVTEHIEQGGLKPEYVEIRDTERLQPLVTIESRAQLLVAAYAGEIRLIDNIRLERSIQ